MWSDEDKNNYNLFLQKNIYLQLHRSVINRKLDKGLIPDAEDLAILEMAKDALKHVSDRLDRNGLTVIDFNLNNKEIPLSEALEDFYKSMYSHLKSNWYPSYFKSREEWIQFVKDMKNEIMKTLTT